MKHVAKILASFTFVIGTIIPIWHVNASTVDTGKVAEAWLARTNNLRAEHKLTGYILDNNLTKTATQRSEIAQKRGYIDHKRAAKDSYYAYGKIEQWFKKFGITFKNIHRATFSESIGYGYLTCSKEDCTQELIDATKSTWNFFMSERNKKSQLHYKALVHKYFRIMGVGVLRDQPNKKYYITVHYGTEIVPPKK